MAQSYPTHRGAVALLLALIALGAGCAQVPRLAVPANLNSARLVDVDGPPRQEPRGDPQIIPKLEEVIQARFDDGAKLPPLNILTLSGGGMYGAFDVGVLYGWTASGRRPTFDVVTGISTGALIATFAFLGPQYDDFLRDAYVHISSDDIFRLKLLPLALLSDSVADSEPLRRKIEAAITPHVLEEVAAAHKVGRRLYVGTTNLDTRQLVVWDMGAIAARGTPESLELFRRVVLASASVPGFFPPVYIDVEVDGHTYREMHVDGGASASVFLRGFMLQNAPGNFRSRAGSNLYVITSGKLYADAEPVQPKLTSISASAISSMLYAAMRSDVSHLFSLALVAGLNYNLIAVPQDFPLNPNSLSFEEKEMQRLFEEGRRLGLVGTSWRKTPPGAEPPEQSPPRSGVRFVTDASKRQAAEPPTLPPPSVPAR
jgi:predicted acylesterase/phospholipase RssA